MNYLDKELEKLFDDLEKNAYNIEYHNYDYKLANQIIRKRFISIAKQYAKEMYEKAKEDCGDRVAYKGEISKVEAWSLSTDELQDRCEELCLSTPLPKELQ